MNIAANAKLYIVIPAYNEADAIAATVHPLILAGHTVVVVDDCSRDRTWEVLQYLDVIRLRHSVNLGQGAALQTGMDYACRAGADIIVHFDADGQHDPEQIPILVAAILEGRADVVFGSRFLRQSDIREIPGAKRFLLRVARIISGVMSGVWLTDAHNGFRALSRTAVEAIRLRENGFAHATEILDEVRQAELRYMEVPTTIRYTPYSIAKGQRISSAFTIALDLIVRKLLP